MRLVNLHVLASGLFVVRNEGGVDVLVELARHVVRHVEQRLRLRAGQAASSEGNSGQKGLEGQGFHARIVLGKEKDVDCAQIPLKLKRIYSC